MKKILLHIITLISCLSVAGQRHVVSINSDWHFGKAGEQSVPVNLPHTYNAVDAFDDDPGYYRGKVVYKKIWNTNSLAPDKKHFLRFGAVNQEATVLINGREVGSHLGGYTSFTFDVTDYLSFQTDTLEVRVDNRHNQNIPPLRGDFTFYGGIYRDVQLITVGDSHFALNKYGSDGVYIEPLKVSKEEAIFKIKCHLQGPTADLTVNIGIDNKGNFLTDQQLDISNQKSTANYYEATVTIADPQLWSLDHPHLYNINVSLVSNSSEVKDEIHIPYGFRDIRFDAKNGFYLNGKYEKLIGVNRHQDRPGIGNALKLEHHLADMNLIKEMGANFLRTAHYPQDKSITEYCDRHGILVSMEIPLDHEITQSESFAKVCKEMTLEMIHQYYNHPSVIIWAYMNEMGLGKKIDKDKEEMEAVAALAQELEDLISKEDPTRYTMIPNHGDFDIYHHFGLTKIPMLVGWNLYYGWYEPDFAGFGKFVDHAHQMVPDRPMLITEYGAGADPRITSQSPERFDFSLEWTYDFHKSHLEQILARNFIAGSAVWNMFDFGSESRQDAVPHVNNKGLCSFDRKPKPVYYLYQSYLKDDATATVNKRLPPDLDLTDHWVVSDELSINFGTNYYFTPDGEEYTWYPSEEIPNDAVSVIGGKRFVIRDRGIGSDRAISLTSLDPVYQTQLVEVEDINVAVPQGHYNVVVHLARLLKNTTYDQVIRINGQELTVEDLEPFTAYSYKMELSPTDSISIQFDAKNNPTFINGLQIFKR